MSDSNQSTNPFGDEEDDGSKSISNCLVNHHQQESLNPFGDEDSNDDGDNLHQNDRDSLNPFENDDQDNQRSLNPFGDEDDYEINSTNNFYTDESFNVNNKDLCNIHYDKEEKSSFNDEKGTFNIFNNKNSSKNQSTLSLQSNISNNTLNNINNITNEQYSFGDGDFQKEGLLCPDCMKEYRTITELMKHFDQEHNKQNSRSSTINNDDNLSNSSKKFSSWSAKNLTPLSRKIFSNDFPSTSSSTGLVGDQIKGFLDKIVSNVNNNTNSSKQSMSKNSSTNSLQDDDAIFDLQNSDNNSTVWSQQTVNMIEQWKYSMKIGSQRSHYDYFRKIRDARVERYVFETNKLMIRLDKLLRNYPPLNDWVKRRKHEQSIVEWIDETIVLLCPSCACKFNILTRKKHHCRLCGAVMCTKCSEFITFKFAYELINPVNIDSANDETAEDTSDITIGFSPLPPMPTTSIQQYSLNDNTTTNDESIKSSPIKTLMTNMLNSSFVNDQELIDKLRVCSDCKTLLKIRKEKADVQHNKPEIIKLYQQLMEHIKQINRLLPVYYRMSNSINSGESIYQLNDAKDLKQKISNSGEQADLLSRKIEIYGLTPSEMDMNGMKQLPTNHVSSKQLSIQSAIRRSICLYLRNNLVGLPEIPDAERFEQLKRQYNEMIEKRIRFEKQMALNEQEKFRKKQLLLQQQQQQQQKQNFNNDNQLINEFKIIDEGFSTVQPKFNNLILKQQQQQNNDNNNVQNGSFQIQNNFQINEQENDAILNIEQDPILQQINIIRLYIKQAKNDHRYEEVQLLEENLNELEIEYYFSQQQQQQSEQQ